MAHISTQGDSVARITVLPNGVTASFPRVGPLAEQSAKRGKVQGWSVQSTRRLRRWFYAVDGQALDGAGWAVTLTVRDLPPKPEDWKEVRERFVARTRRAGLLRGQWLTEFQRRGVPHLHGVFYFPGEVRTVGEELVAHWLAAAADYGPAARGQTAKRVTGLVGWLQYQAKHSVRGVKHYQRATVPEAWREGTGRLWGVVGEWPTREEVIEVSAADYHRFRRLLRGWLVAEARRQGDVHRAAWLRGLLRDPDPKRSRVRAVGEFCPEELANRMVAAAQLRERVPVVDLETGEILR